MRNALSLVGCILLIVFASPTQAQLDLQRPQWGGVEFGIDAAFDREADGENYLGGHLSFGLFGRVEAGVGFLRGGNDFITLNQITIGLGAYVLRQSEEIPLNVVALGQYSNVDAQTNFSYPAFGGSSRFDATGFGVGISKRAELSHVWAVVPRLSVLHLNLEGETDTLGQFSLPFALEFNRRSVFVIQPSFEAGGGTNVVGISFSIARAFLPPDGKKPPRNDDGFVPRRIRKGDSE